MQDAYTCLFPIYLFYVCLFQPFCSVEIDIILFVLSDIFSTIIFQYQTYLLLYIIYLLKYVVYLSHNIAFETYY